jgi:hypothetical protein
VHSSHDKLKLISVRAASPSRFVAFTREIEACPFCIGRNSIAVWAILAISFCLRSGSDYP